MPSFPGRRTSNSLHALLCIKNFSIKNPNALSVPYLLIARPLGSRISKKILRGGLPALRQMRGVQVQPRWIDHLLPARMAAERGHKMAKKKAVRKTVVVQRINRELAAKGQILMTTRRMQIKAHLGDYYILDLSGNVMDMHIDPEKLARRLDVLKEGEEMELRKLGRV